MKPRLLLLFGLVACVLIACSSGHPTVSGAPVYARVVDADTGKPIQGVAVVAYWELYQGGIAGGGPCAAANVEEAVTDENGRFWLPGWGPITGSCGVMRNGNPMLYFFKPGYKTLYKSGGVGLDATRLVTVAQVDWNGKKLKMHKFRNPDLHVQTQGSYIDNFSMLNIDLQFSILKMPAQCNWKKIPVMLRYIELDGQRISNAIGYPYNSVVWYLINNDKWYQQVAPQCGSPKTFLEGLGK